MRAQMRAARQDLALGAIALTLRVDQRQPGAPHLVGGQLVDGLQIQVDRADLQIRPEQAAVEGCHLRRRGEKAR